MSKFSIYYYDSFYLDGPIYPQYQHYEPEYYPGLPYPIYPDENYYSTQIHVKTKILIFFK